VTNNPNRSRRVLILAAKDITQNRRIPLLARYFADKKYTVEVYTYTKPHVLFEDDRVKFVEVSPQFLSSQILAWIEKTEVPLNIWRPRLGKMRFLAWFLGFAELLKYKLRKPIGWGVRKLWGAKSSERGQDNSLNEKPYAYILRDKFGPHISDKRRRKFNHLVLKAIKKKLNSETIIICHDRFSAELTLKLSKQSPRIIFDVVELIRDRTHTSLEVQSYLQTREVRCAEELLSSATLLTVGPHISRELSNISMQVIYNGRPRSQWAGAPHKTVKSNVIAFSGAFFPRCGLTRLLTILMHLPSDFELLLVGKFSSPVYRMEVLGFISENKLETRVKIIEGPDVEKIPKALSMAALYILPFLSDHPNLKVSMPNRLFDAIAAGLPILAQDGLYLADWIKDRGIGDLINCAEPKITSKKIEACLHSPQYELWRQATNKVFIETSYETQMLVLDSHLKTFLNKPDADKNASSLP